MIFKIQLEWFTNFIFRSINASQKSVTMNQEKEKRNDSWEVFSQVERQSPDSCLKNCTEGGRGSAREISVFQFSSETALTQDSDTERWPFRQRLTLLLCITYLLIDISIKWSPFIQKRMINCFSMLPSLLWCN